MTDYVGGRKGKGGGGGSNPAVEQKNTLYSRTTAKILEVISEGPCKGLADQEYPEKSVFFDNVPLMNEDGRRNFEGVTVQERFGIEDQPHIEGFSEIEVQDSQLQSQDVLKESPMEIIFTGDWDAARITLQIPSLTYLNPSTGSLEGNTVKYKIDLKINDGELHQVVPGQRLEDGVIVQDPFAIIDGKNTAPFEISWRIGLLELNSINNDNNTYKLIVTRVSDDYTGSDKTGTLRVTGLTKIQDRMLYYPHTAYVGTVIDGYLFGDNILSRQFDYKGLIVKVPDNYDTETRTYTGVWGGKFKSDWTDNPAWCMLELLTNRRWGLGQDIKLQDVDKWKLYEIAQYCDAVVPDGGNMVFEGVPDGKGGVEPRFTMNAYLTTRMEAYEAVNLFASVFQGMIYWGTGAVAFGYDAPSDPVALFSESNVIDGMFNRSGTSIKSKYSVINVTWLNPEREYRQEIEVVQSADLIARYGNRVRDVVAYGCTSQSQARRYGLRLLDNEQYTPEMITFKAGMDSAFVRPGDIVNIQDSSYAGTVFSGRLKSSLVVGSNTNIIVDAPIPFGSGQQHFASDTNYSFYAVMPSGGIESLPVVNPNTSTDSFTLEGTFSQTPVLDSMFAIETSTLVQEQIRVVTVTPTEEHQFDIAGILYDSGKYARVENGISLPSPITTGYPTEPELPAPQDLSVEEELYLDGPTVKSRASLSWKNGYITGSGVEDPRITRYEVEYINPFTEIESWEPVPSGGITSSLSLNINDTNYGVYKFRVRARDNKFRSSPWSQTAESLFQALTLPPDDVSGFHGYVTGETMNLVFTPVTNLDLDHYEVRFSSETNGTASWAEGQVIASDVPKNATTAMVPGRNGTYMIKAVDQQGDYSVNAVSFISTMSSIFEYNIHTSFLENNTTFDGIHENTQDVSGELWLIKNIVMDDWGVLNDVITLEFGAGFSLAGTYDFNTITDLGAVYNSRVWYNASITNTNGLNYMSGWNSLSNVDVLSGVTEGQTQVVLQVATTEDDPIVDADNIDVDVSGTPADQTTALSTGGAGNVTLFTADNDTVVVGDSGTFERLKVELGTDSSHDIEATFEFWNGSAWVVFTPKDSTNGMTKDGWVAWELSDIPTWAVDGSSEYTIRITRTADTVTTVPVADKVFISNADWSDWDTLVINNYKARAFKYRYVLASNNPEITPVIQDSTIYIDMPDRTLTNTTLATTNAPGSPSDTDLVVDYSTLGFKDFIGPTAPSIAIGFHDMDTGDYYKIVSSTTTGFTISAYNSSNVRIAKNFDWIAKGYGSAQ